MQVQVREVRNPRRVAGRVRRHERAPYRSDDLGATRRAGRRDLLCLSLLSLLACGPKADPAEDHAPGASEGAAGPGESRPPIAVVLPLGANVTLDPAHAVDRPSRQVVAALYDTLLDWNLETSEPFDLVPELLEAAPVVSEDGITVTLSLRSGPGAHVFTDDPCFAEGKGRIVRASDVQASLARSDVMTGRIAGFECDDDSGTLTLTLTRPQPELPALLANPQTGVAPRECISFYAESPTLAVHPVGSGPFALDHHSSEPGHHLRLVANPNVSEARRPGLDSVDLTLIASPETALRLFQSGELALFAPHQAQFEQVVEAGSLIPGSVPEGAQLARYSMPSVTLLLFRMDDAVVGKQKKLRQAVALAFDGERYHRVIRNGVWAQPARRVVPPGIEGARNEALHAYAPTTPAPDQARALIGDADVPPLRYFTQQGATAHHEADLLAHGLGAAGIRIDPQHDARYPATLVDAALSPQLFSVRLDADWPTADYFLYEFTCDSGLSALTHHCDPEYDAMFQRLVGADSDQRAALIRALEARLGEEVPARPIDYPHLWQLSQPWLDGVSWHPLGGLRIERLSVDTRPR